MQIKFFFGFPIQFLTCFIRKHETQFVMQSFAVYENNFFKYKSFFSSSSTLSYLFYYKNNALSLHSHMHKLQFIIASRNFVSLWSHHRQMGKIYKIKCIESDKRVKKIKRIIKTHSWARFRIFSEKILIIKKKSMKSGTFEWHFIKWKIAISLKIFCPLNTQTNTYLAISMQGDDEKLIVVGIKKVFLLWRKTSRPHNTKSRALEYINNILIIFFLGKRNVIKYFAVLLIKIQQ